MLEQIKDIGTWLAILNIVIIPLIGWVLKCVLKNKKISDTVIDLKKEVSELKTEFCSLEDKMTALIVQNAENLKDFQHLKQQQIHIHQDFTDNLNELKEQFNSMTHELKENISDGKRSIDIIFARFDAKIDSIMLMERKK